MTPRQRIEAAVAHDGRASVVQPCRALLRSEPVEVAALRLLAGPCAVWGLDRDDHWPRVWGARGLLWCWDDTAWPELCTALSDPSWRVREMACKVVARHGLDAALGQVDALREDDVQRVRQAAGRAVRVLAAG